MVYPRPLWLALFGPGQEEWPLREVVRAYFQRSHQEHGHRFLKRNLLATAYQTPEVRNEERWWRIVLVAAFQIWLARELAQTLPRPWERYLHRRREGGEGEKEVPRPTSSGIWSEFFGRWVHRPVGSNPEENRWGGRKGPA